MPDFGSFRGFGEKLTQGQTPTQLGKIGSEAFGFIGLLDTYPNAAAAYSVRKLRTAYTGSAIRVRRSSDNTESDIGFTAIGNLDTTSLTSFCGSGDGFVTTWYDQSGNANNATQTTAANQPQIVSSGNVILKNTKATINFNSSKELMQTAIKDLPLSSFSFYQVLENPATATVAAGLCFQGTDAIVSYPFVASTGTRIFWRDIGVADSTTAPSGSSQMLYAFNYSKIGSNNNYQLHRNTTLALSLTSSATSRGFNNFFIGSVGGGQYLNTNMQELILYPLNQSSNRTGIETEINSYYGIY